MSSPLRSLSPWSPSAGTSSIVLPYMSARTSCSDVIPAVASHPFVFGVIVEPYSSCETMDTREKLPVAPVSFPLSTPEIYETLPDDANKDHLICRASNMDGSLMNQIRQAVTYSTLDFASREYFDHNTLSNMDFTNDFSAKAPGRTRCTCFGPRTGSSESPP